MIKILLACGAGASSGFIAQSMRKAAKKRNLESQIKAVSDMEIKNFVFDYDLLLIGPHIAYRLTEFSKLIEGTSIKLDVIDKHKYALLDGEGVLDDALELLSKK